MGMFFFSPLIISILYIIIRPLVQPFAYHSYTLFWGLPLTSVFSLVLILSAYVTGFFKIHSTMRHPRILPLYLMLYLSVVSIYFSFDVVHSIGHILKILTGISLYILIFNSVNRKKDAIRILWTFLLCSVLPMLFGFYQYITETGHVWKGEVYSGSRIDSFLGEYNSYGEFLSLVICAVLMLLIYEKVKIKKMIILATLFSLFISWVLSLNRGSWICLTVGIFCSSLFHIRKIKITWIVIGCLMIGLIFGGVIYKRFAELTEETQWKRKNTLYNRIQIWERVIPLILKKPIIGHGIGTSQIITEKYLRIETFLHNDYLRLSLELGIPAALLYVYFLFQELLRFIKLSSKKESWFINYPMLIAIIYFIIISVFQNIVYNVIVFPMFLGLIGLAHKYNTLNLKNESVKSAGYLSVKD